jgi:hypothetical protein
MLDEIAIKTIERAIATSTAYRGGLDYVRVSIEHPTIKSIVVPIKDLSVLITQAAELYPLIKEVKI